ncbi:hypothetical protein [Oerskovia enterophila]|uniref:hypothetical protein n=1 Tax=Oerskovia enterophila TaxID=43678 RepID=UPI0037FEB1AA
MDRPDAAAASPAVAPHPGFGPGDGAVLSTDTDDVRALAALESLVAYLEQDSA